VTARTTSKWHAVALRREFGGDGSNADLIQQLPKRCP
jgi:hypothetical protein